MAVNDDLGTRDTAIQKAAATTGAVFLMVGILGFIPGVTTHYGQLSWGGEHSGAMLLGLFQVSVLHNLVHLAFGAAGLTLARTIKSARGYLVGGGVIYALLWLYGLLIDKTSSANFVPLNTADNWLHFVLAAGMIALGVALSRHEHEVRRDTSMRPAL